MPLTVRERSDIAPGAGARTGSRTAVSPSTRGNDGHSVVGNEGAHVVAMQRRRLLLGICEVLAEDGFEHASVGNICKCAGVSRRTFYDLFEDRETCFVALLEETVGRLAVQIDPIRQAESPDIQKGRLRRSDWRERVRAALAAVLAFFDAEPALARACLLESAKGGPAVLRLRQLVLQRLIAAIEQGAAQASVREPPPLAAQAIVGGAISVIQTQLLEHEPKKSLIELLNPLMSTIVLPYLGAAAARRESARPMPEMGLGLVAEREPLPMREPFKDIPLRLTFRTARVLSTVYEHPGASNRQVGEAAGITDQGQISKLLRRLSNYGLIENSGAGHIRGEPNAWTLTQHGHAIRQAIQAPRD